MTSASFSVEEMTVDSMLIASLRMTGKYSECASGFGKIGRKFALVRQTDADVP